jgi:hypothetical protein
LRPRLRQPTAQVVEQRLAAHADGRLTGRQADRVPPDQLRPQRAQQQPEIAVVARGVDHRGLDLLARLEADAAPVDRLAQHEDVALLAGPVAGHRTTGDRGERRAGRSRRRNGARRDDHRGAVRPAELVERLERLQVVVQGGRRKAERRGVAERHHHRGDARPAATHELRH